MGMVTERFLLSALLFFFAELWAEPCSNYACDSLTVRGILDSNGLDTVPVSSVTGMNKTRIDSLNLTGRGIRVLPPSIGNLGGLRWLLLGCIRFSGVLREPLCNFLDSLPDEIGNLTGLEYLILEENRLARLPFSIGNCKKLRYLNIAFNTVANLPPSIGQLTELEMLQLGYNPITTLPAAIGSLVKLSYLDLFATDMRELPREIGNLGNLETIMVANTELASLPDEFCRLTALTEAGLYRNKLKSLPDSIVRMSKLTAVFVEYNRLCSLPSAVKAWLDSRNSSWKTTQDCSTAVAAHRGTARPATLPVPQVRALPGSMEISYRLDKNGPVAIELFNVQGKLLYSVREGCKAAGIHSLKLNIAGKMKGMLFVRIAGNFAPAMIHQLVNEGFK
jgi:hypothetical protein